MIGEIIKFVLSNFSLSFLVIGLFFSIFSLMRKPKPLSKQQIIESFFSFFLLFTFGFCQIYNFVLHVFFADMAASFIGWANSPFQYEVGFASLGFGIVGLLSFRQKIGFRAAAIIAPSFFLWGAAGGHIYQMIQSKNFSAGNAGIVFWTDIFIPVIAFIFLYQQYKMEKMEKLEV